MPEDAVILCGGAGLRLRLITGHGPKSMAHVSGRPFLETLFRQLERCGFQRVILAVGFAATDIESYFGHRFGELDVEYSHELSPLGTGGALGNAGRLIGSSSCLVMNGDSYTAVDLREFAIAHDKSGADISVVAVPVDDRQDVGSVLLDTDRSVLQFTEKEQPQSARHLNAGIYMLSSDILRKIPGDRPVSLERELFPQWIREGRSVRAFIHFGKCVDIGTPERYRTAQKTLANAELAAARAREAGD